MDNLPSPPENPFSLQESRLERRTRRNRRRRLAIIVTFVFVVILAGAGYGSYRLLSSDNTPVGTSAQTTQVATSLTGPVQSTLATLAELPTPGAAGTSTSTTTTLAPNLPPMPLSITTDPEPVELSITLQDGTVISGKTPFSQEIPGGDITVELRREGYNTTVRDVALQTAQELKVWLDPEGQLHRTVTRFKCGLGPQRVVFSPDGRELWVAFAQSNGLGIYDPLTGDKTGAVSLGDN
ncbi:MAG: PEGA domain-containing protein, partial [Thermoleophilia bacterium]|nr:PEGA domain-containing protein [Thermoleophilia bacterium]